MNHFLTRLALTSVAILSSTPAFAQTTPTRSVPLCKQFSNSDLTIPCTGVVPIDGATGNPISWRDLFANKVSSDGTVTPGVGVDNSVPTGTVSTRALPTQNADGTKLATDANATAAVTQLTNAVGQLTTLVTRTGTPMQAGGNIGNTAFGISGTLPAFGATPTFNLGALNGVATDAAVVALNTKMGSPFQAGGNIGNTAFGATQSGTWNVGVAGTVTANIGTLNGIATDVNLTSLRTALGSPFQAGGSIANTAFGASQAGLWNVGLTGSLPSFATTQTFNIGTAPTLTANTLAAVTTAAPTYTSGTNAALSLTPSGALRVDIGNSGGSGGGVASTVTANIGTTNGLSLDATTNALFKAGQSIGNTTFGASQSGTWNVGVTGTVTANIGTLGGAATDTKVEAVRALLAGTVKVDNGVALDGNKNATVNLSAADRALLTSVANGSKTVGSFAAMTVGTAYTPGLGIGAACTVDGNIVLEGADGTQITVPVQSGYNQFGFAIAKIASQTATCTFTKLS